MEHVILKSTTNFITLQLCSLWYCQGTESIHVNYDDVDKTVKRYKEKYGLYLVGEDLGNFHVDFPNIEKGCGEAYAIESFRFR